MYSMAMLVGAGRTRAFESALRSALGELGTLVLEQTTIHEWSKRYDWVRSPRWGAAADFGGARYSEVPSLALSELCCGSGRFLSIDLRGPRLPLYNLGLARRLSARLGVWGAAMVNDRLYEEYGCGFFYAGHVIEAAACTLSSDLFTSGGELSWFSGPFIELEAENRRKFFARVKTLSTVEDTYGLLPNRDPIDVFALGAADGSSLYDLDANMRVRQSDARAWLSLRASTVTRAVVVDHGMEHLEALEPLRRAGWTIDVYDLPPSYRAAGLPDGTLDELGAKAAVLGGDDRCSTDELLARLESTPAAATIVRFDAHGVEASFRPRGGAWKRALPRDLPALLAAYDPVTQAADEPPLRWDFRANDR